MYATLAFVSAVTKPFKGVDMNSIFVERGISYTQDTTFSEPIDIVVVNEFVNTLTDNVNHPSHYTFSKYEVIDILQDWFPDEPLLWQVARYISRAKHKSNELEDLKKAKWYLEHKISDLESRADTKPGVFSEPRTHHITEERTDSKD